MTAQAIHTYASPCGNRYGCEASPNAGCLKQRREGIRFPTAGKERPVGPVAPQALKPGEVSLPEVQACRVGSLAIFLGHNGAVARPAHSGASASYMLDDWMLVYGKGGDDHRAKSASGENASSPVRLVSACCPAIGWNFAGETMVIHFPRSTFRGLENHVEAVCAGRAEFAASSLLVAYLDSLWHYLPMLQEKEQHVVEAVTNQLVRSCIVRTGEFRGSASSPASRNRLESAKRYIDERVSSPSLTVENVQGWLGISRRQLYSLFEPYGGVASYILSQRLGKVHSAVTDPLEERPIGRIAEQYGLDPARVERLFREKFGCDPHEAGRDSPHGHPGDRMAKDAVAQEARVA